MALRSFPDLKIELDASEGGALTDISAYVTEIGDWDLESLVEELTAAGDAVDRWAAIGFTQKSEITLAGPYDDQASSLVAICLGGQGETRTLQLTFDGATASDVETVECIISKVKRSMSKGQFHNFEVTLRPTGAIS